MEQIKLGGFNICAKPSLGRSCAGFASRHNRFRVVPVDDKASFRALLISRRNLHSRTKRWGKSHGLTYSKPRRSSHTKRMKLQSAVGFGATVNFEGLKITPIHHYIMIKVNECF
ncbi:MAG: hypothetical protein ABJP79_18310 [Tateyamaria sp.]|uniref:hypothetical protein n=1 Tax=Tateyamaria sp. TaxID=1929288 RepID=UPI00329AD222